VETYVAMLSGLSTSQGLLQPPFNSSLYEYSMELGYLNATLSITPSLPDSNLVCQVNNLFISDSNSSAVLNLTIGANTVTITVTTPDGQQSISYTIIVIRGTAFLPSRLTYRSNPAFYVLEESQVLNLVTEQGDGPMTYTISPPLPQGLTFSPYNGTIVGTPLEAIALTAFVITATNPAGSINTTFNLAVELGIIEIYLFIFLFFIFYFVVVYFLSYN